MAYNRRRPTGGYGVSMFEKASKATFEVAVEDAGFTYRVERENKGEWNESRVFFVNDVMVERTMKGSTPDWQGMVNEVNQMTAVAA